MQQASRNGSGRAAGRWRGNDETPGRRLNPGVEVIDPAGGDQGQWRLLELSQLVFAGALLGAHAPVVDGADVHDAATVAPDPDVVPAGG